MKTLELACFRRECRRFRERGGRCSIEPLNLVQRPLAWPVPQKGGPSELVQVELVLCAQQQQGPGLGWIPVRPLNAAARG